jgi:hypothetical protein
MSIGLVLTLRGVPIAELPGAGVEVVPELAAEQGVCVGRYAAARRADRAREPVAGLHVAPVMKIVESCSNDG